MVSRMSSSWWKVDVPGNSGSPRSISPSMQPRLHMSTPGVYLKQEGVCARAGSTEAEVERECEGGRGRAASNPVGPGRTRIQGALWDLKGESRLGIWLLPSAGQKHLWSSVPACGHILCQGLAVRALGEVAKGSRQAKVTEFHSAGSIQQNIGWLERGMGLRLSGLGAQGSQGIAGTLWTQPSGPGG